MAYTPEQIDSIFLSVCTKIAEDGLALRNILKEDGMPSYETFYKWLSDETKAKQYARATEIRADSLFEEMLSIADTPQEGTTKKVSDKGEEITYGDMINHRRLQVDARKWILSKMNPKKYGDASKLTIEQYEKPIFKEIDLDVAPDDGTE